MPTKSFDHKAAVAAAMDIAFFTCQDKPMPFWPENLHISDADAEDAHAPFMTEAMLYGLLGKEDARSLLHRFRTLMTALGYPAESQHWLLNEAYETRVRTTLTLKIERGPAYDALKQAIRNQGSLLKRAGSPRIDGSELVVTSPPPKGGGFWLTARPGFRSARELQNFRPRGLGFLLRRPGTPEVSTG
jgi:hypothetical protein